MVIFFNKTFQQKKFLISTNQFCFKLFQYFKVLQSKLNGRKIKAIYFIEEYSDDFYESIEDIRQYLMKYNKNYREIKNNIHKIMDRNLNIQKLLDETHLEDGLSAGECKDLSQVIVLYNNLQDILEKEISFKGGLDSYYYFKKNWSNRLNQKYGMNFILLIPCFLIFLK